MALLRPLINPLRSWTDALKAELNLTRALARFPTLRVQRPSVWQYDKLKALEIGTGVWVGPFTEIIAYTRSPRSRVPGKLVLKEGAVISSGCNIRAAGGVISVGTHSVVGQNSVVVAANHTVRPGKTYLRCEWDEERTGVTIGDNCWVAANCVVLPGVTIGDNSVVAAGSVVTKPVPANEIWAGVPARFLKKVGA